jgi:hypothetical protein
VHSQTSDRWCWWWRKTALSYDMERPLAGPGEADALYHTAGRQGQAKQGGNKPLGRRARGRRTKREPGRGHDANDRPTLIAWVSRQGAGVIQATRDVTVKTVHTAATIAVPAGRRLSTDSASSARALTGSVHEYVNHTQQESARGDVHEHRAACLFSLLKPSLRVFRGLSKTNLPGSLGFLQFLRHSRQRHACAQAERIVQAALDPAMASRARQGEFVPCFDHFNLLQTAINGAT